MSFGGGGESTNNQIIEQQKAEAAQSKRDVKDRNNRRQYGRDVLEAVYKGGTVGPYKQYKKINGTAKRDIWTNKKTGATRYSPQTQGKFRLTSQGRGGDAAQSMELVPGSQKNLGADWKKGSENYKTGETNYVQKNKGKKKSYTGIGDDFYDDYYTTIADHYGADVSDQHDQAQQQNLFDLARSGTLRSSVAADNAGDIQKELGRANLQVAERAQGGRDALVKQINDGRKSAELALNSVDDPTDVINGAIRDANAIQSSSPDLSGGMGNMFANALNAYTNYNQVNNARKYNAGSVASRSPTASSGATYT